MAELMSQAEIDELLKSTVGGSDSGAEEVIEADEAPETSKSGKRSKTFSAPKKKELRFHFPYQSPILKSENYVFNPDPEGEPPHDKPVVRTISNFVEYLKSRNQQFA